MDLIRRMHDLLDAQNADIMHAACQFCTAEGYGGDGLNHDDDCVIRLARQEMERLVQTPTIGRIVIYKFEEHEGGMERPAIIVRTWGDEPTSAVQLQVFTDAASDGQHNDGYTLKASSSVVWRTSVMRGRAAGQYHFHDDPA